MLPVPFFLYMVLYSRKRDLSDHFSVFRVTYTYYYNLRNWDTRDRFSIFRFMYLAFFSAQVSLIIFKIKIHLPTNQFISKNNILFLSGLFGYSNNLSRSLVIKPRQRQATSTSARASRPG